MVYRADEQYFGTLGPDESSITYPKTRKKKEKAADNADTDCCGGRSWAGRAWGRLRERTELYNEIRLFNRTEATAYEASKKKMHRTEGNVGIKRPENRPRRTENRNGSTGAARSRLLQKKLCWEGIGSASREKTLIGPQTAGNEYIRPGTT